MPDVFGLPDKLREVVLKFNEQNALDEMILAPATYKNKLTLIYRVMLLLSLILIRGASLNKF